MYHLKTVIFQSTLLQEERHCYFFTHITPLYFQSTLLQEERQHKVYAYVNANILSIHAPTRGATFLFGSNLHHFYLFQSTLLQEERRIIHARSLSIFSFNPRSYKRSDTIAFEFWVRAFYLSIHAPTRGATFLCCRKTKST